MSDIAAIVETNLDQLAEGIIADMLSLAEREHSARYHEDAAVTAREAANMVRIEAGRKLIRARASWPVSGPKAKGWGEFLGRVKLDDSTAWRYMDLAGFRRSPEPAIPLTRETNGAAPGPQAVESAPPPESAEQPPPSGRDPAVADPEVEIDRDTWCTPKWVTDALGPVDLDPCANERSHVQARVSFDLELRGEDGLVNAPGVGALWKVFLNPPYSNVRPWVAAYKHTRFVFLLKLDPSTKWFGELYEATALILIPRGTRIQFEAPPGVPPEKALANQFPHALFFSRVDDATEELINLCFPWRTK